MTISYNIYKINPNKINELNEKIKNAGLIEQIEKEIGNYSFKFYFSCNLEGNKIWWLETYKDFLKSENNAAKNIFYFGLMICKNILSQDKIYAISLGKSHFYLSKYIVPNFGIDLAIRIANENTILLKKSRYFAGTKKQDVSSYQRFQKNNYDAGESVEHLKLKANNKDIWGDKNIIFADSIQLETEKAPSDLPKLFNEIERCLSTDDEVISLPKLENTTEEISKKLDERLFDTIKSTSFEVSIEEVLSHGINISFRFNDYKFKIYYRKKDEPYKKKDMGNSINLDSIKEFFIENPQINDINNVKIQFETEGFGIFNKSLKEVIDVKFTEENENYFLKNGDWFKFNQSFLNYLKKSLDSIETEVKEDLCENDFKIWEQEKKRKIAAKDKDLDNNITYREYYFNKKLSDTHSYELLDRQLEKMQSLSTGKNDYKIEIADLYKDGEIISLKISEENSSLIYNIEQSKTSIELIKNKEIEFDKPLQSAAIWFVFKETITKISEFNSIQFLLAVEAWKKNVLFHGLNPKIYISRHSYDNLPAPQIQV